MAAFKLSTGITLLSEQIKRADYFASGSVRKDVVLRNKPVQFEQDLLFIQTEEGPTHVRGNAAAQDASTLEQAGIPVYRNR
jgi:hypothetical protein